MTALSPMMSAPVPGEKPSAVVTAFPPVTNASVPGGNLQRQWSLFPRRTIFQTRAGNMTGRVTLPQDKFSDTDLGTMVISPRANIFLKITAAGGRIFETHHGSFCKRSMAHTYSVLEGQLWKALSLCIVVTEHEYQYHWSKMCCISEESILIIIKKTQYSSWSILGELRTTQYWCWWILRIWSTTQYFRGVDTLYNMYMEVFFGVRYYLYYALRSFLRGSILFILRTTQYVLGINTIYTMYSRVLGHTK